MAEEKEPIIQDDAEAPKEEVKVPEEVKPLERIRINPGDTIASLAEKYGTTVEKIVADNKLNPDFVFVGQWILV